MNSKAMEAIKAAVEHAAGFPKFPEAFGPRDQSPPVNAYGRIKNAAAAVAEADRIIAKRKARR